MGIQYENQVNHPDIRLSAASLANAHNNEQLISNDYQLFSPEITSKITEHKPDVC